VGGQANIISNSNGNLILGSGNIIVWEGSLIYYLLFPLSHNSIFIY
jgi:hypothetical protein